VSFALVWLSAQKVPLSIFCVSDIILCIDLNASFHWYLKSDQRGWARHIPTACHNATWCMSEYGTSYETGL
jgi:hypothetical protein